MSNMAYDGRNLPASEVIALHKAGLLTAKEARAIIAQWYPIIGTLAAAESASGEAA